MPRCPDVLLVHPGKQHSYEVAIALQKAGRLQRFVTGAYDKPGTWLSDAARATTALVGRARIERLLSKRRHEGLDPECVVTRPSAEILSRTVGKLTIAQAVTRGRSGYRFANWAIDRWVASALRTHQFEPRAVYAFLGGARHTFAACRRLGVKTILDVPTMLDTGDRLREDRLLCGLSEEQVSVPAAHLREELAHADLVIVPSRHVTQTIRTAGFAQRIAEVPFGADLARFQPNRQPNPHRRDRFRVLFAGRLELRKGIHYLVQAWHQAGIDGELILAGSPGEQEFVTWIRGQYGSNVREAGNMTASELAALFADADVFMMLSIAEGSALVTYEALAAGLPCIVTPETGSIVRDGIEGFIVPARDTRAAAARLRELHADRALRTRMSEAARIRAEAFSWSSYHARLVAAMETVEAGA